MKSKWMFCAMTGVVFFSSVACCDFPLISTTSAESNYHVAYNSVQDEFMVAYSGGGYSMLQRFTSTGAPIGTAIYPWGGIIVIYETAIAYNPHRNEYLVVSWDNGVITGTPGIIGLRLDASGAVVGGLIRFIWGAPHIYNSSRFLCIAFNSIANEYLVTVSMAMSGGMGDVFAQRISETGTPLGSAINLTNGPYYINGHALAYAPIANTSTPTGRYLFVANSVIYMLDSNGNPIPIVHDPDHGSWYLNIPFVWGTVTGSEYHPDIAYGVISGQKRFLVVWSDYNNKDPHNSSVDWTGIWGGYVDAEKLYYHYMDPVEDTSFPVSAICQHGASTGGSNWWLPRVLFSAANSNFFTVWRETAADNACNDNRLYHVRGARIDYLYRYPPYANAVLSQTSGTWPGMQEPLHSAIGATTSGKLLVTWDDNRNSGGGYGRDIYAQFWTELTNDNCADAKIVSEGQTFGTLLGATNDGGASCGSGQPDAWFSFTAPISGVVKINTCGTNDLGGVDQGIDTVLSVHSGCPGTGANELACNDDWPSGSDSQACSTSDTGGINRDSAVKLTMTQGQTVLIRVSQYSISVTGSFILNITIAPINDDCVNALYTQEGSFGFDNTNASTDGPTESGDCSGIEFGSDIWYRYHASCTGTATVSLCGSLLDTMLSVYNAACPSGPNQAIACNDDYCGNQSQVTFPAGQGNQYLIRVGGYRGAQGQGKIFIYINPADINIDCKVNLHDFQYLSDNWMMTGCVSPTWCGEADINHDGTADIGDLELFASHWLE
jgi:hypothetical protein